MKITIFALFFVLTIFIAFPAQAQLTVYDDFSGPFVDTARWGYNASWGANVLPYEGGFRIIKGKLSFFNRGYGAIDVTDETEPMKRRLFLKKVSGVNSIEASIQVAKNGHEITGCSSENNESSETRIYVGGSFFNDGSGVPGSGNYTGDILVGIGLYNSSNSINIPAGYMGVRARVRQCTNSDCTTYNQLYETFFPDDKYGKPLLLKVGKREIFRITLDKPSKTFTFNVGKKKFDTYQYAVNDTKASGALNGGMRIEVSHDLANCPASVNRAVGWADVLFDYVSVD